MSSVSSQRLGRVRTWLGKGSTLFVISVIEISTPFVRMLILARFLDLGELGFASALAATYGIFETTTDLAVHRFVFRAPPDEFDDAMASAHALMLLRGIFIAVLAIVAAPLIASMLSVGPEWKIFAALGPIALVRAFENLGPRVAERNYQFNAQFKIVLASNGLGLIALVVALYLRHDHTAIVVGLLGQMVGYIVSSQIFSETRYRIKFRSPQFSKAFKFGYPLMFNGFGIAISGQGDRFVVGSLLGLQALGLYNVLLMVTVVPTSLVFRVMGTTNLAAFYNASTSVKLLQQRLRLAGELSPLVATVYALGVAALMNVVTPVVFGARFAVGRTEISLLALAAFVRIIRVEPFTSFLLFQQRTKRLAASNLAVLSGLVFAFLFVKAHPTIDAAFAGRLMGEVTSLGVTVALTQAQLAGNMARYGSAAAFGFVIVAVACVALSFSPPGLDLLSGAITLAAGVGVVIPWGIRVLTAYSSDKTVQSFAARFKPPPMK